MVNLLNSQATGEDVFLAKSDDNLFLFHCSRAQRIKRKKFINAGGVLKEKNKKKQNKTQNFQGKASLVGKWGGGTIDPWKSPGRSGRMRK